MNYLARAEKFGQDIEAIKSGKLVTSEIIVHSLDEFREFFAAGQSDAQRQAYQQSRPVDNGIDPNLVLAMDYVFGQQEKTQQVEQIADLLFPLPILVTSGTSKTFDSDEVVGPQASPWALNVGTLTFSGGSLTVNSTVSNITADNLVIDPTPTTSSNNVYHIGIVGNPGTDGSPAQDVGPYPGTGGPGGSGGDPVWGTCNAGGIGGKGSQGTTGYTGNLGNTGGPGVASMTSTIIIAAFDPSNITPFVVQSYSGAGGTGSKGGTGGKGQQGGTGGDGCSSGCEGSNGGIGGPGGQGGTGGTGGNGGDAVAGSTNLINFPASASTYLKTFTKSVDAGPSGDGGDGGPGGDGGDGGRGGKHSHDGAPGGVGPLGGVGANGTSSSVSGAAGNISVTYT
ncbi:MAG: hypothetical protein Q7K57_53330 [Burkholderiaceae bacterium]|nr:hypothetical protein [Burkholderiaceae bacterium]